MEGAPEGVDVTVREREYRVAPLNQQDLDRNFSLATTNLFKWMQAARMDLPWLQAGYRALGWLPPGEPTRRLLVASQMVRMARPGVLSEAVGKEVVTHCEIGAVGKTSIEFRYTIFFGNVLVGTGATSMVVVSGRPGDLKPSPVPEAIRALASANPAVDRDFLIASLDRLPKTPPDGAYCMELTVRYSDEDVNRHANHSALARFFEDAKEAILADDAAPAPLAAAARQQLAAVLIGYAAEARAGDRCEVRVAAGSEEEEGVLCLWVVRLAANRWGGRPGLIGRGQLRLGGGAPPDPEALRASSSAGLSTSASKL